MLLSHSLKWEVSVVTFAPGEPTAPVFPGSPYDTSYKNELIQMLFTRADLMINYTALTGKGQMKMCSNAGW